MIWYTADLHFGHANIIRYCNRPFNSVDEMNEALIDRWNAVVAPDDIVMVLGDFAMGRIDDTLPLAARLAGDKVLIPGNHDRCWFGHYDPDSKRRAWVQRYLDAGFSGVSPYGSQGMFLADGARPVTAHHFPYAGDSGPEDRYSEFRPPDRGGWLLHGHVHDAWKVNGRQINVGCDVWGYRPVSTPEIVALIDGIQDDADRTKE